MDQVTLHLRLAGAPPILAEDRDAGERVMAMQHQVSAEDLAILERERIERFVELVFGKQQRRMDADPGPSPGQPGARVEIVERELGYERQRRERRASDPFELWPVGDDGTQTVREHRLQVVHER